MRALVLPDDLLLPALLARDARAVLEAALEANGSPWSRRLSGWFDALVLLEEAPQRLRDGGSR